MVEVAVAATGAVEAAAVGTAVEAAVKAGRRVV